MANLSDLFGGHFMSEVPNPYPVYTRLRREEPVKFLDVAMMSGFMATRCEDVMTVLRDAALYSSRANAKGIGLVMGKTIRIGSTSTAGSTSTSRSASGGTSVRGRTSHGSRPRRRSTPSSTACPISAWTRHRNAASWASRSAPQTS